MSTYRCSAGHAFRYTFVGEEVRRPCPTCGVDVFKFRDRPIDEDEPAAEPQAAAPALNLAALLKSRKAVTGVAGFVVLAVVAAWLMHRTTSVTSPVSPGAVIPVAAAAPAGAPPAPKPTAAADVAITSFKAAPTGAGTVKVDLHLDNRPGNGNDYPDLAVRWRGTAAAGQRIGRNSYAHPPLPFTSADVTLELEVPEGATGIDVTIAY
jgi:hypothetical protein